MLVLGEEYAAVFRLRGFQRLINLWADGAESATSIRYERQYSSFSRKLADTYGSQGCPWLPGGPSGSQRSQGCRSIP